MTYNIRRYSDNGIYYGERVFTGSKKACLIWLKEVLQWRRKYGWNVDRKRTHFNISRFGSKNIKYVLSDIE